MFSIAPDHCQKIKIKPKHHCTFLNMRTLKFKFKFHCCQSPERPGSMVSIECCDCLISIHFVDFWFNRSANCRQKYDLWQQKTKRKLNLRVRRSTEGTVRLVTNTRNSVITNLNHLTVINDVSATIKMFNSEMILLRQLYCCCSNLLEREDAL